MPQVKPSKRAVHVIGPVQEPLDAVRNILKEVEPGSTVVDLSAGQFISLAGLHEEAKRKGLAVEKVKWIDGHDFTDSYGEVSRKEYVRWLSEQANEPLFGGKSVKDAFVYREEVALWWFGEMSVKQPEQHPYRWLFFMIFVLQDVREHVPGATWHLWVSDERTGTALNGVLRNKEISIHLPDMAAESWKLGLRRSRLLMGMYSILRAVYQCYGILRSVWGHRSPDRGGHDTEAIRQNKLVLVQTFFPNSWADVADEDQPDPTTHAHDHYFGDAPWRLAENGFDVRWMPCMRGMRAVERWCKERERQSLPDVYYLMQFGWRQALKLMALTLWWTLKYVWYFECRRTDEKWRYKGIPMGPWLREEMRGIVIQGAWRHLLHYNQYQTVIEHVQPYAVLYRDEFYAAGRVVSAALKGHTRLIGVQHGMLGNEHTVYQFHGDDIANDDEGASDYIRHCPTPDAFAAFGQQAVSFFEEWEGYPAKWVWPIGGLRHDRLLEQYGNLSAEGRRALRQFRGLPTEAPVILLCTGLRSIVPFMTAATIDAAQEIADTFIIVKPHQYHGGAKEAGAVAAEKGFTRLRVCSTGVYPLIALADVVICGGSTVLQEASLLRIPSIAMIPGRNYTYYPFNDGESLVQTVSSPKALPAAVQRALRKESASARHHAQYLANRTISASTALSKLLRAEKKL